MSPIYFLSKLLSLFGDSAVYVNLPISRFLVVLSQYENIV